MKVKSIAEVADHHSGWAMLFYGVTGVGKTYLLAGSENCLLINTEAKDKTLRGFSKTNPSLQIAESRDINEIMEEGLPEIKRLKVSTVGLDSFSSLCEWTELDLITERQEEREENAKRFNGRVFGDKDMMEMKDWGKFLTRSVRLLKTLPDSKINVVFTCHAMQRVPSWRRSELTEALSDIKDPTIRQQVEDEYKEWQPKVRGQLADNLGAYFDVIGFMEKLVTSKGEVYRIWFHSNPHAQTKNCGGRLPKYMDNPTMADILAILNGEVNVEEGESKSTKKSKVGGASA